jgi:hypothetical protein
MYRIERLPTLEMKWGVVDEADRPVLFVELARAPECEVYEYEEHHPSGRGALLATFFGTDALERACDWVTIVALPRLLHSRQNELDHEAALALSRSHLSRSGNRELS